MRAWPLAPQVADILPGGGTCHRVDCRALAIVGLEEVAEQAYRELCEGFDRDYSMGGTGEVDEFYSRAGRATGYEGALVGVPHALVAVARYLHLETPGAGGLAGLAGDSPPREIPQ